MLRMLKHSHTTSFAFTLQTSEAVVIVKLCGKHVSTEMSNLRKRQGRAREEAEAHFCSVTTLPLVKSKPQNQKTLTKCSTETRDEQATSRPAERALPPLPSFKTLVKSRVWTQRTIAPPCSTAVCRKLRTAGRRTLCAGVRGARHSLPARLLSPARLESHVGPATAEIVSSVEPDDAVVCFSEVLSLWCLSKGEQKKKTQQKAPFQKGKVTQESLGTTAEQIPF